ncbi:MAG: 7-carboxy-7-deazaguanine synthase QueE [Prevotella sp.]|nr:7-carboxy-7-deazaguanine synthase QueE [Prevotella sp.]
MKAFRVNDIFYSLQGEGRNTGRAAVFIRYAGCNMKCSFCDTEFNSFTEMTADEIVKAIADYPARFVVLTGGEPTLQVGEDFIELLHAHGYEVAMESNGTLPAPKNLDWLTVSPKGKNISSVRQPDEIKIVFESEESLNRTLTDMHPSLEGDANRPLLFLQPCDTGDAVLNAKIMIDCIDYIERHPQWRLSLQAHKLINIK